MLRTVPLFGRGFKAQAQAVSAQQRINLYLEPTPDGEKGQFYLAATPGLTLFANLGDFPSRGAIGFGGNIYTVNDAVLYQVNPSGGNVPLGSITTGSGPVSMAWNGFQLMMVDGVDGWIWTAATGVFELITDLDFPDQPGTVTVLASRFIVSVLNTGRFHWSSLLDGLTWGGLDFATAESETDNLVAVSADSGSLVLIGELTTEFWAPNPAPLTSAEAFSRVGGAGIEWGCAAVQTITKFDTGLAWLAKNRMGECRCGRLNGYTFTPFDGPEESRTINAESDLQDATAFSYVMNGHAFWQLNAGLHSYLYDALTQSWSYASSGMNGGRHRGNLRAALVEQPYVFDHADGKLYLLDKDSLTDNGAVIVREVTTRRLFNAGNRFSLRALQVDCEVGGLSDLGWTTTDAGSGESAWGDSWGDAWGDSWGSAGGSVAVQIEPQMMLQISRDGGQTWGSEQWRGMGATGQYLRIVIWRNQGLARDLVVRLRVTDAVKPVLIGASAMIETGDN